MASGEKIVTNLVGHGVQFRQMPNEELSGKRGIIRSVRTHLGEVIYTIQLFDTDKLVDLPGHDLFALISAGVPS